MSEERKLWLDVDEPPAAPSLEERVARLEQVVAAMTAVEQAPVVGEYVAAEEHTLGLHWREAEHHLTALAIEVPILASLIRPLLTTIEHAVRQAQIARGEIDGERIFPSIFDDDPRTPLLDGSEFDDEPRTPLLDGSFPIETLIEHFETLARYGVSITATWRLVRESLFELCGRAWEQEPAISPRFLPLLRAPADTMVPALRLLRQFESLCTQAAVSHGEPTAVLLTAYRTACIENGLEPDPRVQ